jgi:hypothetical protein
LGYHDPSGYANHDMTAASDADSPGTSPRRPSTAATAKRKLRRVPALPKRGASIDTTVSRGSRVSSSSVGTSILSGLGGRGGFSPPAYQEVDPLRERAVGVAF